MTRYVYFIKPVDADGPIKIGCSDSPKGRLCSLMCWSPVQLEIVATVEGGFDLEKNIHECFADTHSHREWFHASGRLTNAIRAIAGGVPVDVAIDLNDRRGRIKPKRAGGAAWSAHTRHKMGVFHRVRHACKRIGVSAYRAPEPIGGLVQESESRFLTEEELALIKRFADDPSSFTHAQRTPAPRKEAV